MAQSGGHAWSTWFKIDASGIVINLRKLNSAEVDAEKLTGTFGGGVTVQETMIAAKAKGCHLSTFH